MIVIDSIQQLRDNILQYQPYFQKGFADVDVVEMDGARKGIYLIDSQGEFEYAQQFDYNFFYIRKNGNISVGGNSQDGYILQPKFRLFAAATDVDQYRFVECLFSTLATFCTGFNIASIETEPERVLMQEMRKKETVMAALSRFSKSGKAIKIVAIDFSTVELFNSFDVRTCNCNPCNPCATK